MPKLIHIKNEEVVSMIETEYMGLTDEQVQKIEQFDEEKISSMEIKFKENVTCKQTHGLNAIGEIVESIILKLI